MGDMFSLMSKVPQGNISQGEAISQLNSIFGKQGPELMYLMRTYSKPLVSSLGFPADMKAYLTAIAEQVSS